MEIKKPDIRYLQEMKKVIYDREWLKKAPNYKLYFMYRGLKKENGLRYNITVIPPRMLGEEFVKTKGHDHKGNFKEIYTVLNGQAIYLFQKCKNKKVSDVFAIKARRGESALIPKGYGHITINPGKKVLKEADWAVENCQNDYKFIEKMKGMCYYYTKSGWIKNENYKSVPKLKFKKPLKKAPKDLSFLL